MFGTVVNLAKRQMEAAAKYPSGLFIDKATKEVAAASGLMRCTFYDDLMVKKGRCRVDTRVDSAWSKGKLEAVPTW